MSTLNYNQIFIGTKRLDDFVKMTEKKVSTANIILKDHQSRYIWANDVCIQKFHLNIIGKTDIDVMDNENLAKEYIQNDQNALANHQTQIFFEAPVLKEEKKYLTLKSPLKDSRNHVMGIFGISFPLITTNFANITDFINKSGIIFPQPILYLPSDVTKHNHQLTKRERECAYHLTRGRSAKETGNILHISSKTVECHIATIKHKLDCYKRSEMINKILDLGLLL